MTAAAAGVDVAVAKLGVGGDPRGFPELAVSVVVASGVEPVEIVSGGAVLALDVTGSGANEGAGNVGFPASLHANKTNASKAPKVVQQLLISQPCKLSVSKHADS